MKLKDKVRFYKGEFYGDGHIIEIEDDTVTVDFLDWKQRFKQSELRVEYIHFEKILVAMAPGECIEDFR